MAWAVERLSWDNFNPEFWAYGQFPLYLSFFTRQFVSFIFNNQLLRSVSFGQATNYLRFWSAFFSVLTVVVGYLLGKEIFKKEKWGLITALLLTFTPGLIQMAHFGTTESLLTFVGISSAYLAVKYYKTENLKYLILSGLVGAIGMASKLNAVLFLLGPFLAIIFRPRRFRRLFFWGLLTLFLTFIFSPYYILAFNDFWGTFTYESNVARGISEVFYTRQFYETKPFLFQFTKIFPWTLGLTMFSLLIISFWICVLQKRKLIFLPATSYQLLTTFTPWFLFNSLLFAKWTRFITPILPFFVLFIAYGMTKLKMQSAKLKVLEYVFLFLLILPGIIYTKIYFQPDNRVRACQWLNKNLPEDTKIVYEGGNIVDLPRLDQQKFDTVGIDFYHLDDNPEVEVKLKENLADADFFFSPSRRMFTNHLRLPEKYPKTADFYQGLFTGRVSQAYGGGNFSLVKEFHPFGPVGRFLVGSDLNSEETWTVFDHPTLRLWKRM